MLHLVHCHWPVGISVQTTPSSVLTPFELLDPAAAFSARARMLPPDTDVSLYIFPLSSYSTSYVPSFLTLTIEPLYSFALPPEALIEPPSPDRIQTALPISKTTCSAYALSAADNGIAANWRSSANAATCARAHAESGPFLYPPSNSDPKRESQISTASLTSCAVTS